MPAQTRSVTRACRWRLLLWAECSRSIPGTRLVPLCVCRKEDVMNRTFFTLPRTALAVQATSARNSLSCVWIVTGDPRQPLARIWIDRAVRFVETGDNPEGEPAPLRVGRRQRCPIVDGDRRRAGTVVQCRPSETGRVVCGRKRYRPVVVCVDKTFTHHRYDRSDRGRVTAAYAADFVAVRQTPA